MATQNTNDPFPQVTSSKFPKQVRDILTQNGRNVSALEKQFQDAINQGGSAKEDAVNTFYNFFDEVQGTTQFRSVLDSYKRSNSQVTPSRNEASNTGLLAPRQGNGIIGGENLPAIEEAVDTSPQQQRQQQSQPSPESGQSKQQQPQSTTQQSSVDLPFLTQGYDNPNTFTTPTEVGIGAGWNSIVDKVKGLAQAVIGARYFLSDVDEPDDQTVIGGGEAVPYTKQEILPTDSTAKIKLKNAANKKLEERNKFLKTSNSVGKWIDDNLKNNLPQIEAPVYYDTQTKELNTDNIKDVRSWVATIAGSAGGSIADLGTAVAATRLSRGKSPQTQALIKKGARALTFVSSTAQMFPGYLQEGLDNGLSYGDALKVAGPLAMANGAIELVGLEYMMKGVGLGKSEATRAVRNVLDESARAAIKQLAKKEITQEAFLDAIQSNVSKGFKRLSTKGYADAASQLSQKIGQVVKQGFIPEAGEEIFQGAAEQASKELYNKYGANSSATDGQGRFPNSNEDRKAALTNTMLGAFVGGIVGGSFATAYSSPQLFDQSMFSYANSDIRHQLSQGTTDLSQAKENGRVFKKIQEWADNGEFDVQQNGQRVLDQQTYDQVVSSANLMYDTAWDFRNFDTFDDVTRFDMFSIAKTRQDLRNEGSEIQSIRDQINQIDQLLADPTNIPADESGNVPSQIFLENQKAQLAKSLGAQVDGRYQKEIDFENTSSKINNILTQSVPAINDPQTRRIGRSFLYSNLDAISWENDAELDPFVAENEVVLQDGTVAVVSAEDPSNDSYIRKLVPQQVEASVLDQIDSNTYKPVRRLDYVTAPLDNFQQYQEAVLSPSRKVSRDTTKNFIVSEDAREVLTSGMNMVSAIQNNTLSPEQAAETLPKLYNLYNNISQHPDAAEEGVPVLTLEQFNQAIGVPSQVIAQEENVISQDQNTEESIQTQGQAENSPTVRSLIDAPVMYEGRRSNLSLDGQTVVASPIGTNQIFEIGNIDEIGDQPISNFGIQKEESVAQANSDGTITVRDKVYQNRYSNKLSAINRNKAGDVTSVTLDEETEGGKFLKRTFRGQVAQDIAYEIILQENAQDDTTEQQFNDFAAGNEFIQSEIVASETPDTAEGQAEQDTDAVPGSQSSETTADNQPTNTGELNEIPNQPGDAVNTEDTPSLESEYTSARQLSEAITDITQQQDALRSRLESLNQLAESIEKGETINESDVSRLIAAVEQYQSAARQLDGRIEEATTEIGAENVTEPSNSDSITQGTSTIELKKRRIPNSQAVRNPRALAVLNRDPYNVREEVMQYFIAGGRVKTGFSSDVLGEYSGREEGNRISLHNRVSPTVDALAEKIYEERVLPNAEESEYRDELINVLRENNGRATMIEAMERNNIGEEQIDPDFIPDETDPTPLVEEEDDYVPFSFSQPNTDIQGNNIYPILDNLGKAFPNIILNIPQTQEQYIADLNVNPANRNVFVNGESAPYGYINPLDGSINLDPSRLNANTAIHEYGHIWTMWAENNQPELYQRGTTLVRQGKYIDTVNANPNYANLSPKQKLDEALAMAIGDKGESFVLASRRRTFKDWLTSLFNDVKRFFGIQGSAEQIQDTDLEAFTNDVVQSLLSGNEISGITSQDISDILTGRSQPESLEGLTEDQIADVFNPLPDILYSFTAPTPMDQRQGAVVKTSQEFKAEAESMLSAALAAKTKGEFTGVDTTEIDRIQTETGWEFQGKNEKTGELKWDFDLSQANNKELKVNEFFFTDDDRVVRMPVSSPATRGKGIVADAAQKGISLLAKDSVGGNLMNRAARITRLFNIETMAKILNDESQLFSQIITQVKRNSARKKNLAQFYVMDQLSNYAKAMAPLSTYQGSNLSQVKKIEVPIIIVENGKAVKKNVFMPIGTAMSLYRTHKSEVEMGKEYLTRPDEFGNDETRSTFEFPERLLSGNNVDNPDDIETLFTTEGIQKGATLQFSELLEKNAKGELVPLKNSDGKDIETISFLMTPSDIKKLGGRFEKGIGAGAGEVEAFKLGDEFYNNEKVTNLLADENDKFLNPARPFERVKYYSPLSTVSRVRADTRVNAFTPNLEDSKRLHEREKRPEALYIQDDLRTAQFYMDAVSNVLGNARLVHNLKNIRDAISVENQDTTNTKQLIKAMDDYIASVQNFDQAKAIKLSDSAFVRFINWFFNKNTKFIFRGNLGISFTQFSTYGSALGQGYIDTKYLVQNAPKFLGQRFLGTYLDVLRGGGSTVNLSTGEGLTALGGKTTDAEIIEFLTGQNITDPVKKDQFLAQYATLINRALNGNPLYLKGVDFVENTKASTAAEAFNKAVGSISQARDQFNNWQEEYLMSPIRRADRAVIFGVIDAAMRQAKDKGLTGDAFNSFVANAAENTVYATNQMNDVNDTTGLQRGDTVTKFVSVYTGQSQKLFNTLFQSLVDYHKFADSAPDNVKKELAKRLGVNIANNLVVVPIWIATTRIAWTLARTLAKGDELKEPTEYVQDALWDWLRLGTSIIPGWTEQISSMTISLIDNQEWKQTLFEIPGIKIPEQALEGVVNLGKDMVGGETPKQSEIDKLTYNMTQLAALLATVPKSITDVLYSRLTDTKKPAPKRRIRGSQDNEQFAEEFADGDDFADEFDD
jgi:hypothetical protein